MSKHPYEEPISDKMVRNHNVDEHSLLFLMGDIWTYWAWTDALREDWEESKNVRWTAWREERELDSLRDG